jgi:hypothetical protein
MRHAGLTSALPIGLLALPVILPAGRGGLVSAARRPQLLLPYSRPAAVAAIALASITTGTDSEKHVAGGINAPPHAETLSRSVCCHGVGHSTHNNAGDDRTDDCAFGADDVASRGSSPENYVFK